VDDRHAAAEVAEAIRTMVVRGAPAIGVAAAYGYALAIAGDYMSAASFLGISGLVFSSGFDGLIYSIGFLVGWPVVTFLIAEPLLVDQ